MGAWVADRLHERIGPERKSVLVLGLTFKENVPDLRNSRVIDIVRRLQWLGHEVDVADPLADPAEGMREYGLTLVEPGERRYAMVVGAVPHEAYRKWDADRLGGLLEPGGVVADVKRVWDRHELSHQLPFWTL